MREKINELIHENNLLKDEIYNITSKLYRFEQENQSLRAGWYWSTGSPADCSIQSPQTAAGPCVSRRKPRSSTSCTDRRTRDSIADPHD